MQPLDETKDAVVSRRQDPAELESGLRFVSAVFIRFFDSQTLFCSALLNASEDGVAALREALSDFELKVACLEGQDSIRERILNNVVRKYVWLFHDQHPQSVPDPACLADEPTQQPDSASFFRSRPSLDVAAPRAFREGKDVLLLLMGYAGVILGDLPDSSRRRKDLDTSYLELTSSSPVIQAAAQNSDFPVALFLLILERFPRNIDAAFIEAARSGSVEKLDALFRSPLAQNVVQHTDSALRALCEAALAGHEAVVAFLMDRIPHIDCSALVHCFLHAASLSSRDGVAAAASSSSLSEAYHTALVKSVQHSALLFRFLLSCC